MTIARLRQFGYTQFMQPSTFFIDLDDTVYPSQSGLWKLIRRQMNAYMVERLNFTPEEASRMRARLFREYGTTLKGLKALYQIDEIDFLDYVHDIPVHDILQPDPALRELLLAYPQRKIIFTNASRAHACRVLEILGISDCFDTIIDVIAISPYCKPQLEAFEAALRLAGTPEPDLCVMIDDSPDNLAAAREVGFYTIGIGPRITGGCADAMLSSLHELPRVIPLP